MTDTPTRPWTDADVELVRAVLHEADYYDNEAARAVLDALAADGRLADPQELERLREEVEHLHEACKRHGNLPVYDEDGHLHDPGDMETTPTDTDRDRLADALHADQCPEDPDDGEACTCDTAHYERLAGVALDALVTAGTDPQQLQRLRAELAAASDAVSRLEPDDDPDDGDLELHQRITRLVQTRAEASMVRQRDDLRGRLAEVTAARDAAREQVDELRARVAELEATCTRLRSLAQSQADPNDFADVVITDYLQGVRDATKKLAGLVLAELEQPGRWELPAEPGPEVAAVWGASGTRYDHGVPHGHGHDWLVGGDPEEEIDWLELLREDGPLSATPPGTGHVHTSSCTSATPPERVRTADHCLPCGEPLIRVLGRLVHQATGERACPSPVTAGDDVLDQFVPLCRCAPQDMPCGCGAPETAGGGQA